ncbi:MAG: hypothetical protein DRQ65_02535 [Gammaproteobacteria bacterium]|nr:MAG: hypothetical protein DRQ98_02045 [Gammaproteobacteria bacterium]RLA56902.1 MAG: hypothetical protein DRQ65_02535 [Gammaproteobacteria bacterium]HDY83312.1 hypothetical protein [Halieaceae bacterium]
MLSESSYHFAIYAYVGAACVMLLYLAWWLGRHWGAPRVALVVLLGAALLLTPAYPKEGVDTFAPALIVAGFQLLTDGYEAAGHALRPLGFMSALAGALALLLGLTVLRGRGPRKARQEKPAQPVQPS